jgi:hypothetical protein
MPTAFLFVAGTNQMMMVRRHYECYFFGCPAMYSSVFIIFLPMDFHQRTPLAERNHEEPQPTRPFFGPGEMSAHIDGGNGARRRGKNGRIQ